MHTHTHMHIHRYAIYLISVQFCDLDEKCPHDGVEDSTLYFQCPYPYIPSYTTAEKIYVNPYFVLLIGAVAVAVVALPL